MSNTLAIATVTATFNELVNLSLSASTVSGAQVTNIRPDDKSLSGALGVNVFLYQVTHNLAFRNSDLPTRRGNGALLRRPQTALDLHYLITFYGDDVKFEPQLMMGAVMLQLHASPVLSPANIQQAIKQNPNLASSDLAGQSEFVRITPSDLSLDDLNKLWMMFPEIDYALSVEYVVGPVLIETVDTPPAPALPVLTPTVQVQPFTNASIGSVSPQFVTLSLSGPTTLTLTGTNLNPNDQVVFTSAVDVTPVQSTVQAGQLGGEQLVVILPGTLHAGVNTVALMQNTAMPGLSPIPYKTNAAAFVLRPNITVNPIYNSTTQTITLTVSPSVGPNQQVELLLSQTSSAATFSLPSAVRTVGTPNLTFSTAASSGINAGTGSNPVPAGTYQVRVRVDDAESIDVSASGTYSNPTVIIS